MRGSIKFWGYALAVTGCVLCILIYIAFTCRRAAARRDAIAQMENEGGALGYEYQQTPLNAGGLDGPPIECSGKPPGPPLLRKVFGDAYYLKVDVIDYTFRTTQDDPIGLGPLQHLTETDSLVLEGCPVSNQELTHLESLRSLQSLDLGWTQIDDTGMCYLKHLYSLKRLNLQHTAVTDAGLRHLSKLHELEHLSLNDTSVSDAGLRHLSELNRLKELDLGYTEVSGTGLGVVPSSLTRLRLRYCPAEDSCLQTLGRLSNLERLSLRGTRVTNDICEKLTIPTLMFVDLSWTFVTNEGKEELRSQVPRVDVAIGTRVSDEDVTAIRRVIFSRRDFEGSVLGFSRVGAGQVEVHTGTNRGTVTGKGLSYVLRKSDDCWEVVSVTPWVS